ncbi:MAG: hypothetical protein KBF88_01455 [Polyangiaceae bacterium]|nr:hypothetical protein [Polyangiaceae bacterium]
MTEPSLSNEPVRSLSAKPVVLLFTLLNLLAAIPTAIMTIVSSRAYLTFPQIALMFAAGALGVSLIGGILAGVFRQFRLVAWLSYLLGCGGLYTVYEFARTFPKFVLPYVGPIYWFLVAFTGVLSVGYLTFGWIVGRVASRQRS